MARYLPRRRRGVRRAPKRGPRRARYAARRYRPKLGSISMKRVAQSVVIRNTAVAGTPAVSGYAGAAVVNNLIQLGTPEADTNYSHAIYNVPFSCQFSLNQLVQYTDLTGLADRYCIKGVAIKAKYNANTVDATAGTTLLGNVPVMKWVVDNDDAAPQSVSSLQQKMGLKSIVMANGKFAKTYVRPHAQAYLIGGAAAGGNVLTRRAWINSAQVDIPHYGLKGYIEGLNLQAITQLDSVLQFEFVFYVGLKDLQ